MSFKPNPKDSETNQQYYRQEGDKTIAKVTLGGVDRFELWVNKKYLGFENTYNEAIKSEKWK